jgi:ribose/xylose/arabinose/galactoside ABC-type transport system permease subunit
MVIALSMVFLIIWGVAFTVVENLSFHNQLSLKVFNTGSHFGIPRPLTFFYIMIRHFLFFFQVDQGGRPALK